MLRCRSTPADSPKLACPERLAWFTPRVPSFPLDSLDKACLAAMRAPWSSFAPTWKVDLTGRIDEALLQRAFDALAPRYPFLSATIQDGRWVVPERPRLTVGTATSEEDVLDAFLELETEPAFEALLLRTGPSKATLYFHQHHALADGRAFLGLLGDFFQAVSALERNDALPAGFAEVVPRRQQREVVETRGLAWWVDSVRGAASSLSDVALALISPVAPLRCNEGLDYESGNRTLHHDVPLERFDRWKATRSRHGLSTNDLLAGALLRALTPWSAWPLGTHSLFFPVDARPRTGFTSFANHLSNVQLRWTADPSTTALEFAQHVQRSTQPVFAQRLPWVKVPFDDLLGRINPLEAMRRAVDRRQLLTNFSFSNLLPLGTPGGPWRTETMALERLRITTPCVAPQAVNLTVARSNEQACFNFNFKPSAISEAEVAGLRDRFCAGLDELERALG